MDSIIFVIAPLFFDAMFIVLPLFFIVTIMRSRKRQQTWTPTVGTITRVRSETVQSGESRRDVLIATYEYRDQNGQIHTGEGDMGRQGVALGEGPQPIDLVVNPLDPAESEVKSSNSTAGTTCSLIFLAMMLAMGLLYVLFLWGLR